MSIGPVPSSTSTPKFQCGKTTSETTSRHTSTSSTTPPVPTSPSTTASCSSPSNQTNASALKTIKPPTIPHTYLNVTTAATPPNAADASPPQRNPTAEATSCSPNTKSGGCVSKGAKSTPWISTSRHATVTNAPSVQQSIPGSGIGAVVCFCDQRECSSWPLLPPRWSGFVCWIRNRGVLAVTSSCDMLFGVLRGNARRVHDGGGCWRFAVLMLMRISHNKTRDG